jgi:hypothetical protein
VAEMSAAIVSGIESLVGQIRPGVSNVSTVANIIEEFNPMNKNVDEWINAVDEFATIYGWDDKTISHLALSKLRGPAAVWYRGLPTRLFTWPDWCQMLRSNFKPKRNLHHALKTMMACVADEGASLCEYVYKKLALIYKLKLPLTGADQVNLILGGIQNEQIIFSVETAGVTDPHDLARHFRNLDEKRTETPSRYKINKTISKLTDNIRPATPKTAITTTATVSNVNAPTINRHTDSGRFPLICYICHKSGHIRRNCPERSTSANQMKSKSPLALEYKNVNFIANCRPNDKYFKTITIKQVPLKCFIDFGSECSLIARSSAQKLKLKFTALCTPIVLSTLSDGQVRPLASVNADIEIDGIAKNIDLFVVEKCVLDVDILIGQNFTESADIKVVKTGSELQFFQDHELHVGFINECAVNVGVDDSECVANLLQLLDEYKTCIATNLTEVGKAQTTEMKIELTTTRPVTCRPRRFADAERQEVRDIVEQLLRNGVIRESNSAYSSPVLLVGKKTGEKRLCVDYRALNKITIKDRYPLPLIEDQLRRLSGFCYFTSLDLFAGYHQIPMSAESISFTAFVTQDGQYEFLRMPFGLCNGAAVFQRMINNVLGQLRFTKVLCYLDDILIPAISPTQSLEILREVLTLFQKTGLTLKLSKCFFLKTKLEYLGYEISQSNIQPSTNKIKAVSNFPTPKNVHQVRQYLGLTGYFRKFIKDYAKKAKPLSILLQKNAAWTWGKDQDYAFTKLKQSLTTKPVLTLFDPELKIRVYSDASRIGLGGILAQVDQNQEKVVAYFSRCTTNCEQKYHSFELETLAIVEAVKRFRQYLWGRSFEIVTDCAAVRHTFAKSEMNARVGRWILELGQYNYEIIHRNNQQMRHVDALSRNPPHLEYGVHLTTISEEDWMLAAQLGDKKIATIKTILETGDRDNNKNIFNDYALKGGKVHKVTAYGLRWVVPEVARFQILKMAHDDSGHFAFPKTYEIIASKFWFPHMRRFINKYVSNCLNCIYFKIPHGKKPGFLHPIKKIPKPFHTIHLDHLGPFIKTKSGKTHLLVIIDAFTKFLLIYPVKNTSARWVIRSLKNMFQIFGVPKRMISDQGTAFTSRKFENFVKEIGSSHHLNAVALPRGNGQVERYNGVLLESLATMGANDTDDRWDENVSNIQVGINGTINRAIGVTPSQALMGFRVVSNGMLDGEDGATVNVEEVRNRMIQLAQKTQHQQQQYFDSKRKAGKTYAVGDLVLIKVTSTAATGTSRKLLPKWRGPFRVVGILDNDRYEIHDIPGATRAQKAYRGIAGIENMRPWIHLGHDGS